MSVMWLDAVALTKGALTGNKNTVNTVSYDIEQMFEEGREAVELYSIET